MSASRLTVTAALLALGCLSLLPARANERDSLRAALDAFDQAVDRAALDPTGAKPLYADALARFESLRAAGVRSSALAFNLGNTHYRLGDLGRAILEYRRAQQIAPRDERVRRNLAFVRERITPQITPSQSGAWSGAFLLGLKKLSLFERLLLALALGLAGWGWLTFSLVRHRAPRISALPLAVALLALALGAQAAWELRRESQTPDAVVLSRTTLRLGRGEGYEPALSEPLGPGVEVRIIEERAGWAEVELPDGKRGWLTLEAVERV